MEDTRLQMPVFWNELGQDAQEDLLVELSEKFGVCRLELLDALVRMDRNGKEVGHVVMYEYDIKSEMGLE